MDKLSDKQIRFCEEYLIDLNATQAAIRTGYSKKTAKEQASRLLTNVNVSEYIAELQSEVRNRTEITVDFVINGIKDIAVDGEHENNRLKAFDMLGRHLGIYETASTEDDGTGKKTITIEYS